MLNCTVARNPYPLWLSAEKKVIPARGKAVVDTQISIAVPPDTYGRVAPRSGLGEDHLKVLFFSITHEVLPVSFEVQH